MSLTSDGITLTVDGTHHWAGHIATVLAAPNAHAAVAPPQVLLASIRDKNRLWHEYWRPSNWAFLYGDRTSQPSSRDHLNPQVRWLPAELEKYRSMIETQEQEIWQQAAELERRVP